MSAGPWSTVYAIAGKRYATKMGDDSMSDHGYEILQAFVVMEQQAAMRQTIGETLARFAP